MNIKYLKKEIHFGNGEKRNVLLGAINNEIITNSWMRKRFMETLISIETEMKTILPYLQFKQFISSFDKDKLLKANQAYNKTFLLKDENIKTSIRNNMLTWDLFKNLKNEVLDKNNKVITINNFKENLINIKINNYDFLDLFIKETEFNEKRQNILDNISSINKIRNTLFHYYTSGIMEDDISVIKDLADKKNKSKYIKVSEIKVKSYDEIFGYNFSDRKMDKITNVVNNVINFINKLYDYLSKEHSKNHKFIDLE